MSCRYNLDSSVCNNAAAKRASRHLGHFYDEMLAPCKLRATQFALLQQVDRLKDPSMSDLASALVLDRSALSHTIRPLERDGLVALASTPNDRRQKRVTLTEAGAAKLEECYALWTKAQARFEASYGSEEAALLRSTLDQISSLDFAKRRLSRAA